jgi:cephalosporin-C deacetylase
MLIDMPVSELFAYQGRNPRPEDHDAYWQRALEELDAAAPRAELLPAKFSCSTVDCFDLWYNGIGGAGIHAKYIRPKKIENALPAVFVFHGYSAASPDWFRLLPFAASGIAVAAMDCRGQGGLSEEPGGVKGTTLRGHIIRGLDDSPDKLLFRQVFLDTVQLVRVLAGFREVDENRLGCCGISQGGGLTIACAALDQRIKRAAPIYPFLSDYKRIWELDLAKDAYWELTEYFRRHDPRHEREDEVFTKLGYIDVQFLAPRVKAEVLFQTGLMDTVCPPSSQFAAYNKIGSPKKVLISPDFAHEEAPGHWDNILTFMAGL